MEYLYLQGNQLTGSIPTALGSLSNLTALGLNNNRLTGSIPVEFGDLWSLRDLYLENNQLSGAIPEVLADRGLRSLYLAGNSGLTGCVPAALTRVSYTDVTTLGLTTCAARPTFTLTTSTTPPTPTTSTTGRGDITPATGVHTYGTNARVRVTGTPNSRSRVASWGGDCAATPATETACILTMDANKTASVTFERITYTLTAVAVGGGSVSPSGTATHFGRATVSVTATWDDATHVFRGWTGDCRGTEPTCTLTMDTNKTVTATFAARCAAGATDPTCIRVVYIGAPDDYTNVADIPENLTFTPNSEGRYEVGRGEQITVVTGGASLPAGYTRFYLQRAPLTTSPSPVSASQLIPPVGTTYTFTPTTDPEGAALITFNLTAARPLPQSRPGQKPELGDVVVTTQFEVVSCDSGIAVPDPTTNTELVEDCETLLAMKDTLAGTATLNWSAGRPMTEWEGITVGGTPRRVTKLSLANSGLTGELPPELGALTALTELRLNDNDLTGSIPPVLGDLENLTKLYLNANNLTGLIPSELGNLTDLTHAYLGGKRPARLCAGDDGERAAERHGIPEPEDVPAAHDGRAGTAGRRPRYLPDRLR